MTRAASATATTACDAAYLGSRGALRFRRGEPP
jgi:hypothetical protein